MRSATKRRVGKDPEYLAWMHTLPCVACWLCGSGEVQAFPGDGDTIATEQGTPTEAAHVGPRGLSQKAPDRTAIPLCVNCHREGPCAIHLLGKRFWKAHNINRDELIEHLNELYELTHMSVLSARDVVGLEA